MFCFDCITVTLGESRKSSCPGCMQRITQDDLCVINDKVKKEKKKEIKLVKDKMDALKDIISNKKDGSFIIFANFTETFTKIEKELKDIGVPYHILKGQGSTVQKYITDFKEKRVNVLMLNAKFFGAGMNLQMTTDIIMYHRFTDEMEEQIVGRAQRLGRDINLPLNVYYLVHDNEKQTFENNFSFKDKIIGINDLVDDIKDKQNKNLLLDDGSDFDDESSDESEDESEDESDDESDDESESEELDDQDLKDLKNIDVNKTTKLNKNNIVKSESDESESESESESDNSDMENVNMD